MLKQRLTKSIALAATVALLAGCPAPTPTASPSDSATASTAPSTATSPSATTPSSAAPSTATSPSATAPSSAAPSSAAPSSAAPSSAAPSSAAPASSTQPTATTGGTSDIKELATFNGKVYDTSGVPVEGATVTAKSVDPAVAWTGEAQQTQSGAFVFRNAPVGARLEITAKKDGWTTRTRTEVLKSNINGDPKANVFEFGNGPVGTDPNNLYSIQDEPEVTSLKINGKMATDSDTGSTANPNPRKPETVPGANLTGISSDSLTVEMTFSEPVRRDDVENYFRTTSTAAFNNRSSNFTIDRNLSSVSFTWAADDSSVTVKTAKGILANKTGDEARYLVDFTQSFRDKTDKPSKSGRAFRFSPSKINDYHVFSVKNQDQDPYFTNIQAIDGGSSNDLLKIQFSKPMDVINQTVPQALLADPAAPNDITRQLFAYNTNNGVAQLAGNQVIGKDEKGNNITAAFPSFTNANNATVLGFKDVNGNFRVSYVIGRIKSADLQAAVSSKTGSYLFLSALGGGFGNSVVGNLTGQYGGGTSFPLKSAKVENNLITLELNPQAFDKDDRVIIAGSQNVSGQYNDKVNNVIVNSLQPTLNLPAGADFYKISDPSGRPLDTGNSSTSANIDINNAQKVATAN